MTLYQLGLLLTGEDALHLEVTNDNQQHNYLTTEDIGEIKGASLTAGVFTGVHTFDLGQNIAGWCRLRFLGPPGYGTYIRHGESLVQGTVGNNQPTKNIYTENLREAVASDTYILHGDPVFEIYEPTFTYHGFRYISVYGSPNPLALDDVECPFVHSETTLKGNFTSSNPIINQIQHNVQWGQLSNSMSLPTDCPQRNERRGWMGDAALTVNEALYNFDLVKFYLNFLNLICDVQLPDGQVPDFVPGSSYNPDPNWGTALPTIAWQVYRHTNDSSLLEPYYDNVRAYVEYIRKGYNQTGLVNLFCKYGDWVPPPPFGQTNRALISSFAFLHDVNILLNMSQVLRKTSDTAIYSAFYEQLTQEFHRVFFNNATNTYADGMQAAQVLALALPGVVPPNVRGVVVDNLVTDISKQGNHVTTGIVSNAQIYPVLSDNGHHDLALEVVTSITYPSYGYMFNNPYENATTIWELWNAPLTGPGMNSRNHHMYSTVGTWFYTHLAGIDFTSDAIIIRPRMASEAKKHLMKKLDCQLSTLYGLVHVSYTRDERDTIANSILLRVTIPPNAQARIMFEPLFPGAQCKTLIEGNKIIWSSGVTIANNQEFQIEKDLTTNLLSVHVGSGQYEFHAVWN
ncbi:hypothetical protein I4U23_011278 [Adineta vaga]|nr:hypothetical protein I4U23_011278 [Adineta vaga]